MSLQTKTIGTKQITDNFSEQFFRVLYGFSKKKSLHVVIGVVFRWQTLRKTNIIYM